MKGTRFCKMTPIIFFRLLCQPIAIEYNFPFVYKEIGPILTIEVSAGNYVTTLDKTPYLPSWTSSWTPILTCIPVSHTECAACLSSATERQNKLHGGSEPCIFHLKLAIRISNPLSSHLSFRFSPKCLRKKTFQALEIFLHGNRLGQR